MTRILFSEPHRSGRELEYVNEALASQIWQGDGEFTKRACRWLEEYIGVPHALLTTSCTHALELAAMLLDLGDGDEVIVPSFTFSSTACAVAIRGARPVFVDVEPETFNIDPVKVEGAITPATRAIFVVHYAGVAADMEQLLRIAEAHGLVVVEDNAHSLGAYVGDRHLGTYGAFAAQSWHATKNISCGEGGALLVNDDRYFERAEILREKGTNRSRFLRGAVDRYTWVDQGSSYLPSDLLAAVLLAQMETFDEIQAKRHHVWDAYADQLAVWAANQGVRPMFVPEGLRPPAHIYYMVMPTAQDQVGLIAHLRERDIIATFHYQPLDSSTAGRRFGRTPEPCTVTEWASRRLVRLPLHANLTDSDIERVVKDVQSYRCESLAR